MSELASTIYGADEKPLSMAVRKQAMAKATTARMSANVGYRAAGYDHVTTGTWKALARPTSETMRQSRDVVANRVRDLVRNNPDIAAGIEKKVNNVVGTGWRLSAKPNWRRLDISSEQAELLGDQIEALWSDYATASGFHCDAERQGDANDLLLTAAHHMAMDDEVFGLLVWRDVPSPTGFQTALQLVHPGRCSNPNALLNKNDLQDGITLDAWGAATGAWFRRALPGEQTMGQGKEPWRWDWFPREVDGRPRLIHCKPMREAGLKRSISKLVSVMVRARQGDQYMDYETQAAMVNAVMAFFLETPFDMEDALDAVAPGAVDGVAQLHAANAEYHKINPVHVADGVPINVLGPGEKPHLTQPGHPNAAFEPFVQKIARTVASVLGITYEQLTMDWSEVNYSSARAAILEVARGFKVEAGQLRKQLMNLWYRAWLEEVFDKGMLNLPVNDNGSPVPDFEAMPDAWSACDWIGTGKGYVDPVKEVQAAGMRIALGISTLEIECAEQGHDWKAIVMQRAKEIRLMLDEGLPEAAIGKIYDVKVSHVFDDEDETTGKQAKQRRKSIVPQVRRAS